MELTELDDIVNRNTFYREKILDEMQGIDHIQNDQPGGEINYTKVKLNRTLWDVIKAYISHIYNINLLPVKGNLAKKALTFQL